MKRVSAKLHEIDAMRCYRDAQRRNLKQISFPFPLFFIFLRERSRLRAKIQEIDSYINDGVVMERVLDVPGFKRSRSRWDRSKDCFYTEINGLICRIDEVVHDDCLEIKEGNASRVTIRECPDGELCTSIILSLDPMKTEDISGFLSEGVPARSVFPGRYETIVSDITECKVGLFPHERPEYINDDVIWFHYHDEIARFAYALSGRRAATGTQRFHGL